MLKAQGAEAIAARFRAAGLAQTDFGSAALAHLQSCFASSDHTGPIVWVRESGFAGDEAAREARDAAGLVGEFIALARG